MLFSPSTLSNFMWGKKCVCWKRTWCSWNHFLRCKTIISWIVSELMEMLMSHVWITFHAITTVSFFLLLFTIAWNVLYINIYLYISFVCICVYSSRLFVVYNMYIICWFNMFIAIHLRWKLRIFDECNKEKSIAKPQRHDCRLIGTFSTNKI